MKSLVNFGRNVIIYKFDENYYRLTNVYIKNKQKLLRWCWQLFLDTLSFTIWLPIVGQIFNHPNLILCMKKK